MSQSINMVKPLSQESFDRTINQLEGAINNKGVWIKDNLQVSKKSGRCVRFLAAILRIIGIDLFSHVRTHTVANAIFKFAQLNKGHLTEANALKLQNTLQWLKSCTGKKYAFTIEKTQAALNGLLSSNGLKAVEPNYQKPDPKNPTPEKEGEVIVSSEAPPPPPPPPGPQPLPKKQDGGGREDMFAQIRRGNKLKKPSTNDTSGPQPQGSPEATASPSPDGSSSPAPKPNSNANAANPGGFAAAAAALVAARGLRKTATPPSVEGDDPAGLKQAQPEADGPTSTDSSAPAPAGGPPQRPAPKPNRA